MSESRMAGRTALITGAGAGIGAAASHLFCQEGAAVLMVDANAEALERTREAILQALPGARLACATADVSDEAAAAAAVGQCVQQWGGLDTLVNNAAMRNYSAAADATAAEWQAMVGVNLVGMSNYCRAALPALRQSGTGSIVNVSSCYAVTGRKGMALYDATKAAQLAYTRSLAFEEAAHGVRANAVCPGSTLTDFHVGRARNAGKSVEQLRTERKDTSLIGRWASPEEIAWPILWLASREASFITGTTLMVDGGLHIM
ncbi:MULTISPECIES: SDR family NAD(P)-dependent oxidoreductase [Comamonadaceae]|uniref:SDR family NAD(P)-dependent oxidoreductase n=1 Tax=Comamonadaceae TaxID=80864 RepID=UPI0006404C9B|nr:MULTISPECIES: SDR family NAD(P)-dependent oxidoreductase [Comamonadaceae]MDE1556922.1 SDR family NAD(P)-dependent oxidoreductase [Comamonas aquatica]MDH0496217.1 SDR family oxidoreductase [Comamonas aquatica]MDH0901125.1 SDR family oxidoreductase [Comamonas aquatica]MDH1675638.1 SDR family oxidoreductase [Comamonas aquatica]MDH1679260.1 SDR family oxidoreductase [Comamonas aquatica]